MARTDASSVQIRNGRAFQRLPEAEAGEREGAYAVLVGGEVMSVHSTNCEALSAACRRYLHGEFSVRRVGPLAVG
jgi:hypothetical protein